MKKINLCLFLILPFLMSATNINSYYSTITGTNYSSSDVLQYQYGSDHKTSVSNMNSDVMDVDFSYEYFHMGHQVYMTNFSNNTYCVLYKIKVTPKKNISRKWGFLNLDRRVYETANIIDMSASLSFSNCPVNFRFIDNSHKGLFKEGPVCFTNGSNEMFSDASLTSTLTSPELRISMNNDFETFELIHPSHCDWTFESTSTSNTYNLMNSKSTFDSLYCDTDNEISYYTSETTIFGIFTFQSDSNPGIATLQLSARCGLTQEKNNFTSKEKIKYNNIDTHYSRVTRSYANNAIYTCSTTFNLYAFN